MGMVWQCDRCHVVSNAGNVDDPPDDWRPVSRPVRGSAGARSTIAAAICAQCDDDLYAWWAAPTESETR